jgi:hypothetical protein
MIAICAIGVMMTGVPYAWGARRTRTNADADHHHLHRAKKNFKSYLFNFFPFVLLVT